MGYKRKEFEKMDSLLTNGKKKFVKYEAGRLPHLTDQGMALVLVIFGFHRIVTHRFCLMGKTKALNFSRLRAFGLPMCSVIQTGIYLCFYSIVLFESGVKTVFFQNRGNIFNLLCQFFF